MSSGGVGDDLRHTIVQNVIPGMVLAVLAVIARFEARRLKRGSIQAHDVLILFALVGSLLQSALVIDGAVEGIGLHIRNVPASNIRIIFILEWLAKLDYALTFTFVKVSVILLYRSIFQGRGFAIASNIVMGYVVSWGIAVVLVSIFSCTPVNGFWDTDIPSTCVSSIQFFAWTTITNIIGDLLILALPIRRVWKLQMTPRQKIGVSAMFLLGGFVVLATVIRLVYMEKMDVADATWTYVQPAIWFTVELNVAVISACLPTLRPLLIKFWPEALASSFGSMLSRRSVNRSRANSKSTSGAGKVSKSTQNSDATTLVNTSISDYPYASEKQQKLLSSPESVIVSPLPPAAVLATNPPVFSPAITITNINTSVQIPNATSPAQRPPPRRPSEASVVAPPAHSTFLSRWRRLSSSFPGNSLMPNPLNLHRSNNSNNFASNFNTTTASSGNNNNPPKPGILQIPTSTTFHSATVSPLSPQQQQQQLQQLQHLSPARSGKSSDPVSPISLASVPMPPASVPMPAPGPVCFQPEDSERRRELGPAGLGRNRIPDGDGSNSSGGESGAASGTGSGTGARGWTGGARRVGSWARYAISAAGVSDTGRLGLDFERGRWSGRWRWSRPSSTNVNNNINDIGADDSARASRAAAPGADTHNLTSGSARALDPARMFWSDGEDDYYIEGDNDDLALRGTLGRR